MCLRINDNNSYRIKSFTNNSCKLTCVLDYNSKPQLFRNKGVEFLPQTPIF